MNVTIKNINIAKVKEKQNEGVRMTTKTIK